DSLKDQRNVRLTFVGHTDNQRLSARTAAIYTDNQGLSESRADTVARFIQEALDLPDTAIETAGRGDTQPVATNATPAGMALNRRVEIGVIYERDERVDYEVTEMGEPEPTDQMRVTIVNDGLQEPGIAGVRLATVEGLVIETDAQGRYHIAAVDGGFMERGRNFIVKVDPATLPRDSQFTTENPRVKRITQGLLNQFDFGVRMPQLRATQSDLTTFEFSPMFFEPGGTAVRDDYRFLIADLISRLNESGGGRVVVLSDFDQAGRKLASQRGRALMEMLRENLPEAVWRNTEVFVMATNNQTSGTRKTQGWGSRVGGALLSLFVSTAYADDCTLQGCTENGQMIARTESLQWHDPASEAAPPHPTDGRFRIGLPGGGVIWATEDAGAMQARLSIAGPRYVASTESPGSVAFVGY
ncbi:MAG: OmpA family protein, partial [Pseudomonadota bacterium]